MTSPIWHPFTQHAVEPAPRPIVATDGAHLIDADGRRILDGISSWWVTTHGHRHPAIMAAIREAAEQIDQVIFAGFTHPHAEALAAELVRLAPAGLTRVFYSDSGSTAVEVALKMALGRFRNLGEGRKRLIVMDGSYHGDTIGTMSVGARGIFNAPYEPLLFSVDRIPFPHPGREQATLDALDAFTRDRRAAALIVEPLVLGAGGMLMYPSRVLAEMRRITRDSGTLLIADEVMTGWGRTGTLFASEQAGISPDILCTSKGLTGGAVPLAATLASEEVFAAHWSRDRAKTFFHSSSYTANPIACAAGLANVRLWRDEPVAERVARLCDDQAAAIRRFEGRPGFASARCAGTIAAVDVEGEGGYLADIGPRLRQWCLERDVLVRPLGSVVYLMPPYCVTGEELGRAWDLVEEGLAALRGRQ